MSQPSRAPGGSASTPRTAEERQAKLKQQRRKRVLPSVSAHNVTNKANQLTIPRRTSSSGSSKSSASSNLSLVFDPPVSGQRNRLCYPEVDVPGKPFRSISLKPNEKLVFLAGGVQAPVDPRTGVAPDWRKDISAKLERFPGLPTLALVRPKLPDSSLYGSLFEELINWEIDHFGKNVVLVFYFHKYTLCPMTLVEFGQWAVPYASKASRPYKVVVGADPEYAKIREIKCYCENKYVVHDNLDDLAKATAEALRIM